MLEIWGFIAIDELLREERARDWKLIMDRLLPRFVDIVEDVDRFYQNYKLLPPVPKGIEEVYHASKNSKYKMPKEYRLNRHNKS